MDPFLIFTIAASILSAGMVYVILKVSHYGESQAVVDKLLKAETEAAASQKKLQGYTQYTKGLDAALQGMISQLKPPVLKFSRDYVHVEAISKDKLQYNLKADATAIIKYTVEFSFALDLSPEGFEVVDGANGIGLKISRPTVFAYPAIKATSQKLICTEDVPDDKPIWADVNAKFQELAGRYGGVMCTEEGVRAVCRLKAMEGLRDMLAKQPGVKFVPVIFVDFK